MVNKILLALTLVVTFSTLGGALKCNVCYASSKISQPSCHSTTTVDCITGYCYIATYTQQDGTMVVDRNCNKALDPYCPDAAGACSKAIMFSGLRSCHGVCCNTDNCNNYTPGNSADGVMVSKIILCLVVFAAGFLFA